MVIASSAAVINITSPSGLWIVFNQYQFLLLLLITGAYFPVEVVKLLTGMNFTLFSFNFLDPLYKDYLNNGRSWNYFNQEHKYLGEMGFDSEGSFYNLFTLILIFFLIAIAHLVYLLLFMKG